VSHQERNGPTASVQAGDAARLSRETLAVVKWWLAPLSIALLAGGAGKMRALGERGYFFDATAALSDLQQKELESAPAQAVANATWAFGSAESVRAITRSEIERLSSDDSRRARALLRFGIIDTNPDGQAAVFAAACAADSTLCDRMQDAAQQETRARFVAPGNVLPRFFGGGHPSAEP
jgi:hypothetical protein